MGFSELPAELHIAIFSYLNVVDLKSIRGVCREFRDNASPTLFREAIACSRYKAFSALRNLSLHPVYAKYVKEIVFDGSTYDALVASKAEHYHAAANQHPETRLFTFDRHTRYQRYKDLYEDQESMREGGVLFAEFGRALEWMPNLTTFIYSPGPRSLPIEAKATRDLLPRGTRLTSFDSLTEGNIRSRHHGIHEVIGAIYKTQYTGFREFRAEAPKQNPHPDKPTLGTSFSICVFYFPNPLHLEAAKFFFSHLTIVSMYLSLSSYAGNFGQGTFSNARSHLANLSASLAEATQLQTLRFHLLDWSPSAYHMYGHIIPDDQPIFPYLPLWRHWPKLQCLSLGGIYADQDQFTNMIQRHVDTLTDLHFSYCSISSGTWANVVDEVLSKPTIKSFSVDHVNETVVSGQFFVEMSPEEMKIFQYEGRLMVDSEGQRHFDEMHDKSVYTIRMQAAEYEAM